MRLPIGIYFGLSSERYHQDEALGSSDIRTLRKSARRYWLGSWMNPTRERYRSAGTKATELGTALHMMVLEGPDKFKASYVRRPDDPRGSTPPEKGAITKAAKAKLMSHQTLLHGDEWGLIEDTQSLITEHPDLVESLKGGENEVSIFWVADDGRGNKVPLKCRFDRLKPRGIGDIKTIENERQEVLKIAAMRSIKTYRYDIQAQHYLEGRRQMKALTASDRVFLVNVSGGIEKCTDTTILRAPQFMHLCQACAQEDEFAFQFIFIQKSFPEVWGCIMSPGHPLLAMARNQIDNTLDLYRALVSEFGIKRWPQTWALEELAVEEMPGGEWGWN